MILQLAEQGRLDLDRPLTDAIPDLRQYDVANAAERKLTFRDCLAHRSFLPAVEPIYTYGDDPARLRSQFETLHKRRFGFVAEDKPLVVEAVEIETIGGAAADIAVELEAAAEGEGVVLVWSGDSTTTCVEVGL